MSAQRIAAVALLALSAIGCASAYHGTPVLVARLVLPAGGSGALYRVAQPKSQAALADIVQANCEQDCRDPYHGMGGAFQKCTTACVSFTDYRLSGDGEGGVSYAQEAAWVQALGGQFIHDETIAYPFPSASRLVAAAARVQGYIRDGKLVIVHCMRGKDRTGGVIAAWQLMFTSLSRDEVMRQRASYLSALDEIIDAGETHELAEIAREAGK